MSEREFEFPIEDDKTYHVPVDKGKRLYQLPRESDLIFILSDCTFADPLSTAELLDIWSSSLSQRHPQSFVDSQTILQYVEAILHTKSILSPSINIRLDLRGKKHFYGRTS